MELPHKLVLIGNYESDQQLSMQIFARLLKDAFEQRGIQVILLKPQRHFAKERNTMAGLNK